MYCPDIWSRDHAPDVAPIVSHKLVDVRLDESGAFVVRSARPHLNLRFSCDEAVAIAREILRLADGK